MDEDNCGKTKIILVYHFSYFCLKYLFYLSNEYVVWSGYLMKKNLFIYFLFMMKNSFARLNDFINDL